MHAELSSLSKCDVREHRTLCIKLFATLFQREGRSDIEIKTHEVKPSREWKSLLSHRLPSVCEPV